MIVSQYLVNEMREDLRRAYGDMDRPMDILSILETLIDICADNVEEEDNASWKL